MIEIDASGKELTVLVEVNEIFKITNIDKMQNLSLNSLLHFSESEISATNIGFALQPLAGAVIENGTVYLTTYDNAVKVQIKGI